MFVSHRWPFFRCLPFVLAVVLLSANAACPQVKFPALTPATVPTEKNSPQVQIELVSEFLHPAAQQPFRLAVVLTIVPGWHLYANPNSGIGLPLKVTAAGDAAVTIGAVVYPPSQKYTSQGSTDDIYKTAAIILIPCEIAAGSLEPQTIRVQLDGQLCSDTSCILYRDQAEIVLTPAAAADTQRHRPELFPAVAVTVPAAAAPDAGMAADAYFKPIVLALAAGLLMNFMPCVLPLIPIIVLTLMQRCAAGEGQSPTRRQTLPVGLAFALGIMAVFAALAIIMSLFKLFWGQQFQSDAFKFILLLLVFILSLSMFGVFEIVLPARLANLSINRQGYLGVFAMGILTTILATPCGAPLLTPVLAWSLAKPLAVTVLVFMIIGASMALPYVLLTAFPSLLNRIPKAGNWMITLKELLGFAMLAFTVYLLLLFPPAKIGPLLYFCLALAFALWLVFHAVTPRTAAAWKFVARLAAVMVLGVASVLLYYDWKSPAPDAASARAIPWTQQRDSALEKNQVVVVKFTANWCKNCLYLDKTLYKTPAFQDYLRQHNVELVIADWSKPDAAIESALQTFNQLALPVAAIYHPAAPERPIVLTNLYTQQALIDAIEQAPLP